MTLKFLGYIEREQVDNLTQALSQHAATATAIETSWQGLVAFTSPRRARIIAASITDTDRKLGALAECFEAEAESIGILRERRAFHPHVTLCRIKQAGDVSTWLTAAELATTPLRFSEVILYESHLRPTGAIYTPIARVPLGG
jgi:2'-5' RNA ligase